MIMNDVYICGERLLSHPVSNLFHLNASTPKGTVTADNIIDTRLVLIDCRVSARSDISSCAEATIAARKPLLMLCPSVDDVASLQGSVPILPTTASAALLISMHMGADDLPRFDVRSLEYSAIPGSVTTREQPSGIALSEEAPASHGFDAPCNCIDFAEIASALVTPEAANLFKVQVEHVMDGGLGADSADANIPTGLKYFKHTYTPTTPFTYNTGGISNGAGALTTTFDVWGFLSQTASQNVQYLVVESFDSLNSGSLNANDEATRGWFTYHFQAALAAPMSQQTIVPNSGSNTFTGDVKIAVSYKSPLGGTQIWDYTGAVNNTVASWDCGNASQGATLGNNWWMTAPCNGSNIADTWGDAFTFWGHVNPLSAASSGTLAVNSIAAWVANTPLSGYQTLTSSCIWYGGRLWGGNCSPGMYWSMHALFYGPFSSAPGFSVDFGPIQP